MAGSKAVYSRWSGNALVYYTAAGLEIFRIDGTLRSLSVPSGAALIGTPQNIRTRFSIAQVNAGATILAAVAGYKYRLIECLAIAIGGAAGAVTTVDILATQTTGVKLVAYAQASLTQSAVLKAGGTGAAVLADGASFVQNDVNTAITIGKTGSSVTTATHIDVILTYALEA
jgi:hypothetical protein